MIFPGKYFNFLFIHILTFGIPTTRHKNDVSDSTRFKFLTKTSGKSKGWFL